MDTILNYSTKIPKSLVMANHLSLNAPQQLNRRHSAIMDLTLPFSLAASPSNQLFYQHE